MLTDDQVAALTDELTDLGQTHGPGANILCQILQTLDVLERTRKVPSEDALRLAHLTIALSYAAPLTDAGVMSALATAKRHIQTYLQTVRKGD